MRYGEHITGHEDAMLTFDLQRVREKALSTDVVGYEVEDLQGTIGKVDGTTEGLVPSFISVDLVWSLPGKRATRRVILPAAVIERIDHGARKVYVDRRHKEIMNAPRSLKSQTDTDDGYLNELRRHYGPGGAGYRAPRDAWTEEFGRVFVGDRIDAAALRDKERPVSERARLSEHSVRTLLVAAGIWAGGFVVLTFLVGGFSSNVDVAVWKIVAVIAFAFLFETMDSSSGMGFGTALSPLLLVLGFAPLQVVPGLLAAEAATGLAAGLMHNEFRNIELSWRPLNQATKTVLAIAAIGGLGAIVAQVLTYYAFTLSETFVRTYIGIVVVVMAAIILTISSRGERMPYRPRRVLVFAAVAGANKGIGAGGYGPVITLGGVLSGVFEKTSVALATMAEGVASALGTITFLVLVALGTEVDWRLLPWLWAGALPAAVISPYVVRVMPSRVWRYVVPVYAVAVAAILFVDTFGG